MGAIGENHKSITIAKKYYDEFIYELDPERGTFMFNITNFSLGKSNEEITLSIEEITAMILKLGKLNAEKQGKIEIKDCVITVPAHWDYDRRISLLASVYIAGLNPLSFIHENSAAALYYAIERLDENKTHTVLIYNIGAYNL